MSQIWRPDTCRCVVEEEYNYQTKPPTLVSRTLLTTCPRHTAHQDVLAENILKNRGLNDLLTVLSTLSLSDEVAWVVDASGNILITIKRTLTTQQRNNITTRLAAISPKLILQ